MAVNFTDDHIDVEDDLSISVKRRKLDAENPKTCQFTRQQAWLDRANPDVAPDAWRPSVTMYRSSAKKWMINVDMQLQQCSATKGLVDLTYDPEKPVWQKTNWRNWTGMGIAMDFGSDGVSAVHGCQYLFLMNVWIFPDQAHGGNCSFFDVLRAIGLWDFFLLIVITLNLEHGPDRDRGRRRKYRRPWRACLSEDGRQTCHSSSPV